MKAREREIKYLYELFDYRSAGRRALAGFKIFKPTDNHFDARYERALSLLKQLEKYEKFPKSIEEIAINIAKFGDWEINKLLRKRIYLHKHPRSKLNGYKTKKQLRKEESLKRKQARLEAKEKAKIPPLRFHDYKEKYGKPTKTKKR